MKCLIGGCRGGNPVTDPDFVRYGFDTTSFLIEGEGGEVVIIDAGTGIRPIANYLNKTAGARNAYLLFTHAHLDHIMGFPSCPLLLNPEWSVDIAMAKRPDVEDLEEAIRGWMIPPWWPVTLDMMPARKQFTMLEPYSTETPLLIGGLEIRWCPQEHPGGSTAFRIDEPSTGSSVVISTDVEWSASSPELQKALQDLCRDATWLIFDGKCTPEEYERFRGYGHSTWMEGIELARSCGVENLIITHHGTDMTDEVCDAREAAIQAVWDKTQLARQGMQWTL